MGRSSGSFWERFQTPRIIGLTLHLLVSLLWMPNVLSAGESTLAPVNEPSFASDVLPESTPAIPSGVAVGRTRANFSVTSHGGATYQIPIWTPAGIAGLQPSISLTYSSASGDGFYGVGWGLAGLSAISRCPKTYAQDGVGAAVFLTSADLYCLNGNKLRSFAGTTYGADGAQYQTEIADFSLVISHGTAGTGPAWFEVHGKNGLIYQYGNTTDSALLATGTTSVLVWSLNRITDRFGNHVDIAYTNDTANQTLRPATITYTTPPSAAVSSGAQATPNYQVQFTYVARSSTIPTGFVAGAQFNEPYLAQTITVAAWNGSAYAAALTYNLTYNTGAATGRSRLHTIQECSPTQCFPATIVSYQDGSAGWGSAITASGNLQLGASGGFVGDLNGDGFQDIVYPDSASGHWYYLLGSSSGALAGPYDTGVASSTFVYGLDFKGNGITDLVLRNSSGNWRVMFFQSAGAAFSITDTTSPAPSLPAGYTYLITGDVDGDGREDVIYVVSGGSSWTTNDALYYQLNTGTGFSTPVLIYTTNNVAGSGSYEKLGQFSWQGFGHIHHPDFNGDGRVDFFLPDRNCEDTTTKCAAGKGTITSTNLLWASNSTGVGYSVRGGFAYSPLVGDYNGDGCADIAYPTAATSGYYWTIQYGTCDRSGATSILSAAVTTTAWLASTQYYYLAVDWDGDGMDDIIATNGYPTGTWGYYHSTGTNLGAWTSTGISFNDLGVAFVADVNGDGLFDIVSAIPSTYQPTVYPHNGATVTPDLATSFTDGFGFGHSLAYVQLTNSSYYSKGSGAVYPEENFQGSRTVVASYNVTNAAGLGSTYTISQYYSDARVNTQGRGFEGFAYIRSLDSRNSLYRYNYYSLSFPLTGMISQSTLATASKTYASVVNTNTYATLDATYKRYFPYVSQAIESQYEYGGSLDGTLITQATTNISYGGTNGFTYGNPSQISTTTVDEDPTSPWHSTSFTRSVSISPYEVGGTGSTGWCIHLPSQVVDQRTIPGGASLTHTTTYGVNSHGECELDSQTIEPSSSTDKVSTAFGYTDNCGNINSISVTGQNPDGTAMAVRTTTLGYGTHCIRPETIMNPLLQTSAAGYRYDLGLQTSVTDPNGLQVSWTYNDIGQKTLEQRPDGTQTSFGLSACSSYCGLSYPAAYYSLIQQEDSTSSHTIYRQEYQYFDQIDRMILDKTQITGGAFVDKWSLYDSLGRQSQISSPFRDGGTAYYTTYGYDIMNRAISMSRPISATNSTLEYTYFTYQGRTSTKEDPKTYTTTTKSDVIGEMRVVTDPDGVSNTSYTYDAFGNLTQVSDPAGNLTTSNYDALGYLPTGSSDPDRGSWTSQFDSLRELINLRDAKTSAPAWTQQLSYDALGRMVQRVEAEGTSVFTWGTVAANHEIGQLKEMSGLGDDETFTYDSAGRLAGRSMRWGGVTYTISSNYNNIGLLNQLTYPLAPGQANPFSVLYGYSYGYLSSIQNYTGGVAGNTFWQLTSGSSNMDAWGHVIDETLGTSTPIRIQSSFDAVTGWVSSRLTDSGTGSGNIGNSTYSWDLNGNLSQRQDLLQSLTEVFNYDNLNRVQTSTLNGTQNLAVSIDNTGNITSRTEGGVSYTYTYDTTHKHAVATVGSVGTYTYDANGNMATRNGSSLTWASYNLPLSINGAGGVSSVFVYGPDRQRKQQTASYNSEGTSGTETTIYVFGLYEYETTPAQTHNKYWVQVPGGTQILYDIASATGTQTTYIVSDHQGSGSRWFNSAGANIATQSYAAYGYRRSSNWSGPLSAGSTDYSTIASTTRRGYTDAFHELLDNVGLVHMNGRVYDPVIGRFLSPDPMQGNPTQSQSWNPYAYVMNRPLTMTDPTGLEAANWNIDGLTVGSQWRDTLWDFASFGTGTTCYGSCGNSPNYYGGLSTGSGSGKGGSQVGSQEPPGQAEPPKDDPSQGGDTSQGPDTPQGGGAPQGSDAPQGGDTPQGDQPVSVVPVLGYRGAGDLVPVTLLPSDIAERIQATFDAAAEIGSNKAKWAQVGKQGEDAAVETLLVRGYRVLASQLYVLTTAGLRVTDFVVTGGPAGDSIVGFEVKVNNSPYSARQVQKDSIIASAKGGVVVNWGQPAFPYGTSVRYTTYLMYVDMTIP